MAAALAEARRQGQGHAEVARRLGVSPQTVKWWSWRIGARARAGRKGRTAGKPASRPSGSAKRSPSFIEVHLGSAPAWPFEVLLGSGKAVRVAAGFDAADLRRLLNAIGSSC
jgi:hypothetical protein